MRHYHQGYFKCKNPQKYQGNPQNIIYRSGWEFKFYVWLDNEPTVLAWGSEEFSIPYVSPTDGRIHRYFPDAWAKMKTKKGIETFLIEIKPLKQTALPKPPKRQTKAYLDKVRTYAINEAKWQAATQFCAENGLQWKIITEKELWGTK